MDLPEYITKEEVQRVCRQLGLRDWTQLTETAVLPEEAALLQDLVGGEALHVPTADFRQGLEVELEHGISFPDANVTNNHPILTAKIVLAHLKEMLDYYARLEVAELEGDVFKASLANNPAKVAAKTKQLVAARAALAQSELERQED
ncbi:MAG: hypothetical protein H6659_02010 [Ardenticatenaceae bacterium]|nr:hypothetical protein [Anaerolineales bacterium]MCB8982579.1 hypothetical protein [Ardenticatenaceae bacterium]MCB8988451.1 hypothetical protein [Ardenticatenaceae bacterium]